MNSVAQPSTSAPVSASQQAPLDADTGLGERWTGLSASEREGFFDAIARHRRASWTVTLACGFAAAALGLLAALLLSPLIFSVAMLAVDLVNLLVPMPRLLPYLVQTIQPIAALFDTFPQRLAVFGLTAALPGALLLGIGFLAVKRALSRSALFDGGEPFALGARPPDRSVLVERKLVNTIEEMAISAMLTAPRVLIVQGGANAAIIGRDETHATVLVGTGLFTLPREQLQGIAAHLVGSLANGDMKIGLRTANLLALFVLFSSASDVSSLQGRSTALLVARGLLFPTAARTREMLELVGDPLSSAGSDTSGDQRVSWRHWLSAPLLGPVCMTGFVCRLITTFGLVPLVGLAWRQRKLMADATAVRLTRQPDALAGALAAMSTAPTPAVHHSTQQTHQGVEHKRLAPWVAHLAVLPAVPEFDARALPREARLRAAMAHHAAHSGQLIGSVGNIFPKMRKRQEALLRIGASDSSRIVNPAYGPMPVLHIITATILLSVAAMLGMLATGLILLLSGALSAVMTLAPAGVLHMLLRALGN